MSCSQPVCLDPFGGDESKVIHKFTIIIQPGVEGKDAGVSTYYPEENFGSIKCLNALTWTENVLPYTERGYIDFEIKKYLPAGAKIVSAYLKLFADTTKKSPNTSGYPIGDYDGGPLDIKGHTFYNYQGAELNFEWQIYRIVAPWNEREITWFDQPEVSMTDILNLPGPKFSSEHFSIDVTEHIRQKYKGTPGYNGFMIRNKVENPFQCVTFCSSDSDQKELRPQLVVEYEK